MDLHTQGTTQVEGPSQKVDVDRQMSECAYSALYGVSCKKIKESVNGIQIPTFNDQEVTELSALLTVPYHFVTLGGTEQFQRVYYHNGKYVAGPNGARLGVSTLTYARYIQGEGLRLYFNTGHVMLINDRDIQITYRP